MIADGQFIADDEFFDENGCRTAARNW